MAWYGGWTVTSTVKCTCGREWPCDHKPETWHTPCGVRIEVWNEES